MTHRSYPWKSGGGLRGKISLSGDCSHVKWPPREEVGFLWKESVWVVETG